MTSKSSKIIFDSYALQWIDVIWFAHSTIVPEGLNITYINEGIKTKCVCLHTKQIWDQFALPQVSFNLALILEGKYQATVSYTRKDCVQPLYYINGKIMINQCHSLFVP